MRQLFTAALLIAAAFTATARDTYNFNSDWHIGKARRTVTLPHAWNEDEAYKVGIHDLSDSVIVYSKTFTLPATEAGSRVFIEFEGARMAADVTVNGKHIGLAENGVMAFGYDITDAVKSGKNNITVRTDNDWHYREKATGTTFQWNNQNFNANYGGLPKNVYLHIAPAIHQTLPLWNNMKTTGQYIYARDIDIQGRQATVCVESQVNNTTDKAVSRRLEVELKDRDGRTVCRFAGAETTILPHSIAILKAQSRAYGLNFWSWGYGYLYTVETTVGDDRVATTTGFRKGEYKNGMVYLNDRVIQVHGYAQRTSNEWPGVGMSVPAWLSDYSNNLLVESGGNLVRWMHVTPWRQDVESCDRAGLIQAMPAGDAEKDADGRQWQQREELMREAIVYFRNSPSIMFYECGNAKITAEHMVRMKQIRDEIDPFGGRAIGCREMLDRPEAEYGGEMLYVNKSDTKPMWMMEYCRDEALRWYWNSWSYPFHKEGDGPLFRNAPADAYNHNNDEFTAELVRRWYDYWRERPGTATRVNAGGVKIVFSDTQTHGRSADNYRVSGVVDPMRVPKDAFYAHQVMWDGWVDDLRPHTYIVGHWNYQAGEVIPTIYVVSNADSVVLRQGSKTIAPDSHDYRYLYTFHNVKYENATLQADGIGQNGKIESSYSLRTAGEVKSLRLSAITNPTGWKADGADVALVQVETVDSDGRRHPLDNRLIHFTLRGEAEWRGGVAKGTGNHALCDTLPVECGITRVMLRSTTKAGRAILTARADGLPEAKIELTTEAVPTKGGLSQWKPADGLQGTLTRGQTPATPSFRQSGRSIQIASVEAGSGEHPEAACDGIENTAWESAGDISKAWITFHLAENTSIDELTMKTKGFRNTTFPIAVYADTVKIWEGWTPKSLSYIHIPLKGCPKTSTITIRSIGRSTTKDAFGAVKEMDARNDEKMQKGSNALKLIEVEMIKKI